MSLRNVVVGTILSAGLSLGSSSCDVGNRYYHTAKFRHECTTYLHITSNPHLEHRAEYSQMAMEFGYCMSPRAHEAFFAEVGDRSRVLMVDRNCNVGFNPNEVSDKEKLYKQILREADVDFNHHVSESEIGRLAASAQLKVMISRKQCLQEKHRVNEVSYDLKRTNVP